MMVNFGQASYIDGTVIPGSELRRNTQRDTGDGSGVVRPGDLKITQMDTPGAGVKIAVGDALIQSRAPSAGRETYGVPLVTAQNYMGDGGGGLPGTGSQVPTEGYRRDFMFLEVLDPGLPTSFTPKEDWPEGQSVKLSVVQNVGPTARKMSDVPALANVTGEALAAIKYPPSTATVTDAMIEDLRKLQSPRQERQTISYSLRESDVETLNSIAAAGEVWPNAFSLSVERAEIPDWATHVDTRVQWFGVEAASAAVVAVVWAQIGGEPANPAGSASLVTQRTTLRANPTLGVADRTYIPVALRGTSRRIFPMARMQGETVPPVASRPKLDAHSSLQIELVWLQLTV